MTLNSDIEELINTNSSNVTTDMVDEIISKGVLSLIRNKSLYGEILLNLNREPDFDIDSFLSLKWNDNQLVLAFNIDHFKDDIKNADDLIAILEHLSMHIVWLHPLRYATHSRLNDVASDVSVNQYVDDVYSKGWTLDKLNSAYGLEMASNLDSSQYAKQISQLFNKDKQSGIGKLDSDNLQIVDDHRYFDDDSNISDQDFNQRQADINKLLKNAYSHYRGQLSMAVNKQIKSVVMPNVDLGRLVKAMTNNSNYSTKTYNRFNRRQPYRMDIAGRIRNQSKNINVFIDSSGSISDDQYEKMVSLVEAIKSMPNMELNCFVFDSSVQRVVLNKKFDRRLLQGGTSYQSIIDYIHQHRIEKQGCIIFTDGKGEQYLEQNNFALTWILLDYANELSIKNSKDRVLYLNQIRV
ncbi:hypothetical protein AKUA2003_06940 [Apilactobacillus kunkeei]|nr:hypothetical protein AKUA1001_06960 [Apilactobacillus kunkeei]CAI2596441.1 hypothetical protein AKUA2003_06940 [Apilactobacillus kunkeei]CAI2802162.1 hypothetical protein AKUA2002_06940 [Apilactobacillus kunkeei]